MQRQVVDALRAETTRLYVDSSVLLHCYEMSRSACEELLSALDSLGARVRVPVWCAKETWEISRGLSSKKPLLRIAGQLNQRMTDFRNHSLRYVDERTFDDLTVDQYAAALEGAVSNLEQLAKRVEKIEPGHDAANARLLPFIAEHCLNSDMTAIYTEVQTTAETRFSHEVPPGHGDGGTKSAPEGEEEAEDQAPQQKGKKRNRYGDLIMWLEALADCRESTGQHLVILTRDNTKKDWAHNPDRVLGDDGRPQQNGGLITLPLPMLALEAKRRCPDLQTVHVISLELFTQVMRSSFGARVSNLARALQSGTRSARAPRTVDRQGAGPVGDLRFGSSDMMFEPAERDADRPIWRVLEDLRADGWSVRNEAAAQLPDLVGDATDDELKQVGRGLLSAGNEDAVVPIETAVQLLDDGALSTHARANIIIGLLAETYFDGNGEPKKPAAHPDIAMALFAHGDDPQTKRAYDLTVEERIGPMRRLYLALPGEAAASIRLQVQVSNGQLVGVQANDKELLEPNAPPARRMAIAASQVPLGQLVAAIAREFVVPVALLEVDGPTGYDVTIPERMGFIAWGPNTGEQLR